MSVGEKIKRLEGKIDFVANKVLDLVAMVSELHHKLDGEEEEEKEHDRLRNTEGED